MAEQFRKKPVTIEAMRFVGAESAQQIFDWLDDHETGASYFPERLEEDGGDVVVSDAEHMIIATLEGTMRASVGDWIIRGVQGEFYPCKPEIFEATYEAEWRAVEAGGATVLDEVREERARQDAKWGEQNHPDGTGDETYPLDHVGSHVGVPLHRELAVEIADAATRATNEQAQHGLVMWRDILLEEVFEALAEDEPGRLRTELIQVAAVATQWVEAIDRREVVRG